MPNGSRFVYFAFVVFAVFGLCSVRATAQPANAHARLDSLFTILGTHQRTMGAVTIRKADRVIYQRVIGYRDSTQAGWIRSDNETEFRVGSVTKPFTAVLIYQLVDQKKLSLDTKLSKFFPQVAGSDSVTVRDLLGHTSGLADYSQGMEPLVAQDRDALLKRIAGPLQFPPGTQRRYSNTNYLLLGYIVETVGGASYEKQLQQGIAQRIGLKHTRFGGAVAADRNEARAYFMNGGHWERQPDDAIENAGGAGGIVSTTNDLTHFLASIFEGNLISAASRAEMTNGFDDGKRINGKGIGPFKIPDTQKAGFSHDGSIGAHAALIGYVPEDSLALALTVNGYNYPINRIFFAVWGILYGTNTPLPTFTPVELTDAIATPLAGEYTSDAYGLTITIRKKGNALEGQTKGDDGAFPLTYIGRNRFVFERDGILIEFVKPEGGTSPSFTLYQQRYAIPLAQATSTK